MGLKGVFTNAADPSDSSSRLFISRFSASQSEETLQRRRPGHDSVLSGGPVAPSPPPPLPNTGDFGIVARACKTSLSKLQHAQVCRGRGRVTKLGPVLHASAGDVLQPKAPLTSLSAAGRRAYGGISGDTQGSRRLSASTPAGSLRFCFVSAFPRRWALSYAWRSHRAGHAPRLEASLIMESLPVVKSF